MKKSKKILIGVLTVLIILLIMIFVRELFMNNLGKLEKSNSMSKEEVIKLLENGASYSNYYYCPEQNPNDNTSLKTEYYIKDDIVVCYVNSELKSWTNYNTKEIMTIWDINGEKKITIGHEAEKYSDSQYGFDFSTVVEAEKYGYKFEYLGEREKEGRKEILIQLNKTEGVNTGTIQFTIDKETGVILGRTDISKILFITTYKNECDRNVKFNVVTDEDVKRPNLEK